VNVVLWIIASLLAVAFLGSGVMKVLQPRAKLAASGMGYVEDLSDGAVKAIGSLEILAAIGLILPPALGIAPVLAPLAALGLILVMIGAIVTHARRGETQPIAINVLLLVLAALPVAEYTALQVKQAVVGQGKAAKEQVQEMVRRLLKLPGTPSADAADALACAICHAHGAQGLGGLRTSGYRVRAGRIV